MALVRGLLALRRQVRVRAQEQGLASALALQGMSASVAPVGLAADQALPELALARLAVVALQG
jgi:hypothetical protein